MYQCNMLDHAKTKLIIKDISTEDMNMIFIHMIIIYPSFLSRLSNFNKTIT